MSIKGSIVYECVTNKIEYQILAAYDTVFKERHYSKLFFIKINGVITDNVYLILNHALTVVNCLGK